MEESIELTILMPCLNEAETIAYSIREARSFLIEEKVSGEILISDNGSTDDSAKIAIREGARVIKTREKGYGAALRAGIAAAKGTYIIMGDCDCSYDFYHLKEMLEYLREGYGLVMGNRFAGGIRKGAMSFLHRHAGVPFLSWLGRKRYHNQISDYHCGLRGFDKKQIAALPLHTTGMEFATELIAECSRHNISMCEVPTILRPDRRSGKSHLRDIPDAWRHIRYIIFHR